ncbi:MAG: SRPBCC domain-containing protein, partial [Planctomycetales bacterium]|nr:SRPBCC domain-containing protein [Planctomycetales bacterium]
MIYDVNTIPADRRIETHRTIPFTPAQVFQSFADPTILATWWGPNGFTNTFHEFEFCDNGIWRFTMHGPDGKDYANDSRFLKIVEPSLVIVNHECAPWFQAHFAFHETRDGCEIDWQMIFENAQTRANVASYAGDANEQNIDRLVAALS